MSRPLSTGYPYGVPIAASVLTDGPTVDAADFAPPLAVINDALADLAGDYDWSIGTLVNSWVAYDTPPGYSPGFVTARYRRWGQYVVLAGLVKSGTGTIFTLPVGYRPSVPVGYSVVAGSGSALVTVSAAGVVAVAAYANTGSNAFVSLDSVKFLRD